MTSNELFRVDGIKWWETTGRTMVPICPQHHVRLDPVLIYERVYSSFKRAYINKAKSSDESVQLKCEEDGHIFDLSRTLEKERKYALNKKDAVAFSNMKTLNLDDESVFVAKEELKDTDYWVRAKVTKSKAGTRLIVWAGSKAAKNKAQLFVEPELQRMTFDQNDDHPTEVFAKVEATFVDGVKTEISK